MVSREGRVIRLIRYVVLTTILLAMVLPLLWMLRVSLMPAGSATGVREMFMGSVTLQSFVDLWRDGNVGRYLFNSLFVGLVVTAGNILFCFMVGYGLARYRSIGNKILFASVVIVLMIPAHIVIIPLYLMCIKAGIYDSYWALIIPWLVNPIGIFLIKQYVEAIPTSLEEAARVDGAGEYTIVFRIVMPLCKPAIAVLAIQVFVTNWNSFLFPYILTSSDSLRTLPVALAMLQGHQAIDWQHLMAGSSLAVLPILVLFIIGQRQIVSGIMAGGIKQ